MNRMLETFVRRMAAEGVRFDPLADLDDLIELQRLASVTTGTDKRSPQFLAALHPQLTFAGQTFQRVSIGCRVFAEDCLAQWYADDGRGLDLAWCWLLAHARRPDLVWAHQEGGPDAFRAAVRRWLRNLACTEEELLETVGQWVSSGRVSAAASEATDDPARDLSGALEELAAEYARPDLNWWIWQAPETEVALLWERMQERKTREGGGHLAENPDNPFVRALRDYRLKEAAVWKKLKARAGDGRASVSPPHPPDASPKSDPQPVSPHEAPQTRGSTGHTETRTEPNKKSP
ncbi:MAG: hypothetical protein J5I99_08970 [Verrucomicrobia bacterium]|nr:hypothetical protein [Verrucomicrobiota bacterium]